MGYKRKWHRSPLPTLPEVFRERILQWVCKVSEF